MRRPEQTTIDKQLRILGQQFNLPGETTDPLMEATRVITSESVILDFLQQYIKVIGIGNDDGRVATDTVIHNLKMAGYVDRAQKELWIRVAESLQN
jgi:Sec7-like guanine-nucleotide exchange factor